MKIDIFSRRHPISKLHRTVPEFFFRQNGTGGFSCSNGRKAREGSGKGAGELAGDNAAGVWWGGVVALNHFFKN
jgi:hypothetical protein